MFGTNETKVELGLFMCSVSGGMKMRCLSFHGMVDGYKMRCNEIQCARNHHLYTCRGILLFQSVV